jgi:hypothetical protein
VSLHDGAEGFARACWLLRNTEPVERARRVAPLLRRHHWASIAAEMERLVDRATTGAPLEDDLAVAAGSGLAGRETAA